MSGYLLLSQEGWGGGSFVLAKLSLILLPADTLKASHA